MKTNTTYTLAGIVLMLLTLWFGTYGFLPKANTDPGIDETSFSTLRAENLVKQIADKPHFTGSETHSTVIQTIVNQLEDLGLPVTVQEDLGINMKWGSAAQCKNILARIEGAQDGKALMLLSHYDSNPHSSTGASDAASGVATILEGIRAYLASSASPKNDIIICITDAEELGLLGAQAFVNHHPWTEDIGLVLNFEARGSGGPSYMLMETNGGNRNLIREFDKADVSNPLGNSLLYSLYKMLPNDTDLTIFREQADINGFNFAFIDDHFDYHTALDTPERMDLNSLQHQGNYLMATLEYFSQADLNNLKAEADYVYFNFPVWGMVYYPFSWALPSFLGSVVLFLLVLAVGRRRKKLNWKGVLRGFIPLLGGLVTAVLLAAFGWRLLQFLHPGYTDILQGFPYNGTLYVMAFFAFTIAIALWFYNQGLKRSSLEDLLIAPFFFWLLINGAAAVYLKGASFLLLSPLYMVIVLLVMLLSKKTRFMPLVCSVLALPMLYAVGSLLPLLPVGLGLGMMGVSSFLTVLLVATLLPVIVGLKDLRKTGFVLMLVGIVCLIWAETRADFNEDRPFPNSVIYVLDADNNEAHWASYNNVLDTYTLQFFGEEFQQGNPVGNTAASKYSTGIKWYARAELAELDPPQIEVNKDTITHEGRILGLSIATQRNANEIELLSNKPMELRGLRVNGQLTTLDPKRNYNGGSIFSYTITPGHELLEVELTMTPGQEIDLDIFETKYDLLSNSEFEIVPRTEAMIPMPFVINDATLIKTKLKR